MITSVILKELPFFQSFTMGEIDRLLENPDLVEHHKRGEYIIVQGSDQTRDLFVLVRGEVEITNAEHQHITYLAAGSIFGEISFITNQPRISNVVALGDTIVVRIDKKSVDKVDPKLQLKIKDSLIDILILRLGDMNLKLVEKDRANLALIKALRERGGLEEIG
ncbi:MAG: cyclic nucleotide-binding domain-containing protein [Magnetococcus sp. THC-1_WYH]